jgi:hypothetical protein
MPPLTPQDLALAQLHRALDEGTFECFKHPLAWNANLPLPNQATPGPLANLGLVQGATPPIGGHRGAQQVQAAMQPEGQY